MKTQRGASPKRFLQERQLPATAGTASEVGAEAVEFALIAPILFMLLLAALYFLLLFSLEVSLAHATSRALRYAVLPLPPSYDQYPSTAAVQSRLTESSVFFKPSNCSLTLTGAQAANASVSLKASCSYPNPVGGALNGVSRLVDPDGDANYSSNLVIAADAEGRRE